ncbi:uncharacterized protein LOC119672499 isoform X2 [Teleopsis dalmanni]|uniref:uncharacterized protein LOC119672499 isoform X2 n=1 Tax=Teleopsis dalmanni TaxID=139649 RepID=UPI0018CE205C|nr:uncharacterized protein LOC119672499 isoform X2 [Teleopsis dalmanni]
MCTLSPQTSIQEEPEQEINDRLHLIQQMQQKHQITTKSDSHEKNSNEMMSSSSLSSNISSLSFADSFNNNRNKKCCVRDNANITYKTLNSSDNAPMPTQQMKLVAKVSFKQRAQKLQSGDCISSSVQTIKKLHSNDLSSENNVLNELRETTSEQEKTVFSKANNSQSMSNNLSTSSIASKSILQQVLFEDRSNIKMLKSFRGGPDISKSRLKTYKSSSNLSSEYIDLPFIKRLKVLKERHKLISFLKSLRSRSFNLKQSTINTEISLFHPTNSATCSNTFSQKHCNSKMYLELINFIGCDFMLVSQDSNETTERQKLMSILKNMQKQNKQCNKKLKESSMRMEGHSTHFLVTQPKGPLTSDKASTNEFKLNTYFTRNDNNHSAGYNLTSSPNIFNSSLANNVLIPKTLSMQLPLEPQSGVKYSINTIFSKLKDSSQKQESFDEVLCGINNLIKSHITEIHAKFETQFAILENEVKKRDTIISKLEIKLKKIGSETKFSSSNSLPAQNTRHHEKLNLNYYGPENETNKCSSSTSSAELLFMRGNSLSSIFPASTPFEPISGYMFPCTSNTLTGYSKLCESYHNYPKFSSVDNANKSHQQSSENNDEIITNADNVFAVPDNEILGFEQLSSSSSLASILNFKKTVGTETDFNKKNQNLTELPNFYHNDWEVQMLAAEMAKQERKRGYSFSENMNQVSSFDEYSFDKRHRKTSYTETECCDTDVEDVLAPIRARACSLDQFNTKYGTNYKIVKNMGIDHDNDKL